MVVQIGLRVHHRFKERVASGDVGGGAVGEGDASRCGSSGRPLQTTARNEVLFQYAPTSALCLPFCGRFVVPKLQAAYRGKPSPLLRLLAYD
jgi:hypothetical protein